MHNIALHNVYAVVVCAVPPFFKLNNSDSSEFDLCFDSLLIETLPPKCNTGGWPVDVTISLINALKLVIIF